MEDIKRNVKASRYLHILGVMDTAANLAMRYSYPVEVARLAGLLHDCTKHMNAEEQLQYCKEHGLSVTEGEKKAPQLLHSKTGAVFAKENYGIQDSEILHAIEVHTTGCREMSLLDKIVFIADYIEPSRDKASRLKEIRAVSYVDLDLAMAMILSDTINYLKNNHKSMDSGTLETYDYYKDVLTRRGQDLTLL
jgi:nicotinate-nucleotide adenylyltransferase